MIELRHLRRIFLIASWFLFLPVGAAFADDSGQPPAEATDTSGVSSPRETMTTFLTGMERAVQGHGESLDRVLRTLDLDEINSLVRREKGRDLAWMLLDVLEKSGGVAPAKISARTSGKPYTVRKFPEGSIIISPKPDGRWLFASDSLRLLPEILDGLTARNASDKASHLPWHLQFRGKLPDVLKQKWVVLEHWQWLGILLIITVGIFIDKLIATLCKWGVRRWRKKRGVFGPGDLPDDWLRPVGLLVLAAVWWAGLNMLGLPERALLILLVAVKVLAGISGIWASYRAVDFVGAQLQRHARRTANKLDDVLVPLVRKTLKVFVTVIGLLFVATNLNMNITGLVAGLGLGGLAFALAAKDLVQNLFGSITVLLDQSFHVGDWVVIGDVEGSVEEVGLRSTRIRTFYNSQIIMPNSRLITASVDNYGRRRYRRMKCNVSLTYDTPPERIEAFCEALRELVRLHPYMRKDYYHVYLNEMAEASLNVLVYVFWETPDWSTELREKHRFLLDILRVAERLEVDFAFPTQTLYLKSSGDRTATDGSRPVEIDRDAVYKEARQTARAIVDQTTGIGVKPPPVTFFMDG